MHRARWIIVDDDLRVLQDWSRASRGRRAQRARIVLLTAQGHKASEVSATLGVTLATVYKWRQRFASAGLPGLSDSARPGQPRRLPAHKRDEIARLTTEELPPRGGRWTIRALSTTLSVTQHQIRRVWQDHELRPHTRAARLDRHPALRDRELQLLGLLIYQRYSALAVGVGPTCLPVRPVARTSEQALGSPIRALFRAVSNATHGSASPIDGLAQLAAFGASIDDASAGAPVHLAFSCHAPLLDPLARQWLGTRRACTVSAEPTVAHWVDVVEPWLRQLSSVDTESLHLGALADAVCAYLDAPRGAFLWVRIDSSTVADERRSMGAPHGDRDATEVSWRAADAAGAHRRSGPVLRAADLALRLDRPGNADTPA